MKLAEADIVHRSHWLREALAEDPDLAPPLKEDIQSDICIIGGGYLGLWTAIRLKDRDPACDVVLIERDICGGGPSGRNSGMVLSVWSKFAALAALGGAEDALRIIRASKAAIDEIEAFCRAEGIDARFCRRGWVWGATCAAQCGAWDGAIDSLARLGEAPARRIGRDEIAAMTGSEHMIAAAFDPSAATVHPGFLARGLRRAALRRGVRVFERTAMTRFSRHGPPRVDTATGGSVTAHRLVLAVNAWAGAIPELAPAIFNIASDDAISQPMPEALEEARYRNGPLMIDARVFVGGWSPTRDGRLSVGVTGGIIGFDGRIDRRFDRPSPRVADMRAVLRAAHPALAGFPLECAWRGPIDRTASGLPLFGTFPGNPGIAYGYGFSGNGITMTRVGSAILADLVTGRDTDLVRSALARPVTRGFPPEPFRFVGAHLVRNAVRRRDAAEHAGTRPGPLTRWLAGLAPSGVTPAITNLSQPLREG